MRNTIVHGKLHHLRINEHKFHIFRPAVVNNTGNNGINAHRFTGTRRSGYEKMRHFRKVCDYRLPRNILTQGHQNVTFPIFKFAAVKYIP